MLHAADIFKPDQTESIIMYHLLTKLIKSVRRKYSLLLTQDGIFVTVSPSHLSVSVSLEMKVH